MVNNNELENWIEETATILVKETLKIIANCPQPDSMKYDTTSIRTLLMFDFIRIMVKTLAEDTLTAHEKRKLTGKEAYDFTMKRLGGLKSNLQTAIGLGFENAFQKVIGKQIEYYCLISPVPEAKTKWMN